MSFNLCESNDEIRLGRIFWVMNSWIWLICVSVRISLPVSCQLYVCLTDWFDCRVQVESVGNDLSCSVVLGLAIRSSTLSLLINTIKEIDRKILKINFIGKSKMEK